MNLQQWWPWYKQIIHLLNLDEKKDREATLILSKMLKKKASPLKLLKDEIRGKTIFIFGAGPSLEKDLANIVNLNLHKVAVLIAADGATSALLNIGLTPDIILTDLDGKMDDIMEANRNGSIVIVHAHGDNIEALKVHFQQFIHPLYGTTQGKPAPRVYNFGGFTDGDRCVFLAEKFRASKIILAGMDLGIKTGKYSKPNLREDVTVSPLKLKKLKIAKQLLEWISTWSRSEILNATSAGVKIKGIKKITEDKFAEMI